MSSANAPLPPETIYVTSKLVYCDGSEGPLGHPRVFYNMGALDYVECGYCDRRFVLEKKKKG